MAKVTASAVAFLFAPYLKCGILALFLSNHAEKSKRRLLCLPDKKSSGTEASNCAGVATGDLQMVG